MNAPDDRTRLGAAEPGAEARSSATPRAMPGTTPGTWAEANQRLLVAELAWLAAMLREPSGDAALPAHGGAAAAVEAAAERVDAARREMPAQSALDEVAERFGLSPFERSVLLLAAAPELDTGLARTVPQPSFGLALARLPGAHWSAVTPTAPLRAWRLVTLDAGASVPIMAARLGVDEAVLHRLTGLAGPAAEAGFDGGGLDGWLAPWLHAQPVRALMDAAQRDTAEHLARQLREANPPRAVTMLHGDDGPGRQDVAAWLAARLGRRLFRLQAADLPADPAALLALAERWRREARWLDLALLIELPASGADGPAVGPVAEAAAEPGAGEPLRALAMRLERFVAALEGLVVIAAPDPVADLGATQTVRIQRPRPAARRGLWHAAALRHGLVAQGPAAPPTLGGEIDALAAQFPLSAAQIDAVAQEVADGMAHGVAGDLADGVADGVARAPAAQAGCAPVDRTLDQLWQACRSRARRTFGALARCTEPAAGWDDLVLPEGHLQQLRHIVAQVRLSLTVHEDWGFAPPGGAAPGVTALFWGDSGVGKTLACEVLAHALRLDLVRVDLAGVVSKYIGETEKNLRRIFDTAEEAGALLLFDEADALFGHRSEVRDSHDRYANQEVAWLLQRMERHRGLVVLTTNQRDALDAAFLRRLRFVLPFPFPDALQRERLWRRMVPARAPQAGLDFRQLATLPLAGGAIRNAALNAAFLAAGEGRALAMCHFAQAARHEAAKDERALPEGLLRAWEGTAP